MKNVELGDLVECKITKFKGVVTGYATMLTGCDRAVVQPPVDKQGKNQESLWVDVASLKVLKKQYVKPEQVTGTKPGGWPTKDKP